MKRLLKRLIYISILSFIYSFTFAQYANTVYLDPTNSNDPLENGTITHPYDDIADINWQSNTSYRLKRGTTLTTTARVDFDGLSDTRFGVYGPGNERPIVTKTSNGGSVRFSRMNRCWVDSIRFIQPVGMGGSVIGHGGSSSASDPWCINAKVTNCEMANAGAGLWSYPFSTGSDTLTMINCEIHNMTSDGIFINSCDNILIEGCHIYDVNTYWYSNPVDADGDGIHLVKECDNYKIYNNIIDKSNTGKKFAFIFGGTNVDPVHGEIIGNTLIPPHIINGSSAIYISKKQTKVLIARNYITGRKSPSSHPDYIPGSTCYMGADTTIFIYNIIDSINNGGVLTQDVSYFEFNNNTVVSPMPSSYLVNLTGPTFGKINNNLSAGDCSNGVLRFVGSNTTSSNNTEINTSNSSQYNSGLGIIDWENSNFHRTENVNDGVYLGINYDYDSLLVSNPPERGACEFLGGTPTNNPPTINNQEFSIDENMPNGASVGVIQASDPDQWQSLTFSIQSGNTNNAFAINASTGALTINNSIALDYETTPEFNLTIRVQDNGAGNLSDQAVVSVQLMNLVETPVTSFSASITTVIAGESINFQDESSNIPNNWIWQFEGGTPNISFGANPEIIYNTPGIYNVGLVASNEAGFDMLVKSAYIEVQPNSNAPVADFTSTANVVTAGGDIYFQDESSNLPINWIWQFEGGTPNSSFEENPVITYNTPGVYTVKLVASNTNGYHIVTKTDYIEVETNNNAPIADFSANTTIVSTLETVSFFDESLNLPTNWVWIFEGGSPDTSFNQNPIVMYDVQGFYNVKLIATNENGYDEILKENYIEVQKNINPPTANFTANTTNVIAGESISFEDLSSDLPINWIWQFEGGTPNTSFDKNPVVSYNTPGIYNVKLVASNSNGFDIMLKLDYIEVDPNMNAPEVDFSANATDVMAGGSIYFQDESLNLPTNWIWQFEGGTPSTSFEMNPIIGYNSPGVYNVKLLASNGNGYNVLVKEDYIEVVPNTNPPVANFIVSSTTVTAGSSLNFYDESLNLPTNWQWQFEGGIPSTSTEENPVIVYNTPGLYDVSLVVSNGNGQDVLVKTNYIQVLTNTNPPVANFTVNKTNVLAGESLYFQDESLNFPSNWIWQFEGGTPSFSFEENPIVSFKTPGIYNVKLVVSNSNGYDVLLKLDHIEVQVNPNPPLANFSANKTTVFVGESIYFQDESLNLPTNWMWQFEGGTPSTSFNEFPVISYNTPGVYQVKLVVSNDNGFDILIKTNYIQVLTEKAGTVVDADNEMEEINEGEYAMTVYPNPANNTIHVNLPGESTGEYTIKIYSLFGEIAKELKFNTLSGDRLKKIDIGSLQGGTYIIQIHGGETMERRKFIKL